MKGKDTYIYEKVFLRKARFHIIHKVLIGFYTKEGLSYMIEKWDLI